MNFTLVQDIFDITADGAGTLRRISAAEAFRRYNWIADAPLTNVAGNYQGMVISAQWNTVYTYSSSVEDKVGNIAILLSVADELIKSRQQITSILNGNDDRYTKAAKLSAQVSGIAFRVLAHLATGTISTLNWVLRNTRWINMTYWLDETSFMKTVDSADTFVTWLSGRADSYLSGGNIYYVATIIAVKH